MKKTTLNHKLSMIAIMIGAIVTLLGIIVLCYKDTIVAKDIWVTLAFMVVIFLTMIMYLYFADRSSLQSIRKALAMTFTMVLSFALIMWFDKGIGIIQLAPIAMCAITVSVLVSRQAGFASNIVIVAVYFAQSIVLKVNYNAINEGTFYFLMAGLVISIVSSFAINKQYNRLSYIAIGGVTGLIAMAWVVIGRWAFNPLYTSNELWISCGQAFIGCLLSVMVSLSILPIIEVLFNIVTPFRYAEIATTNNRLMQQLYNKAPGTYNHSMTVATYVEACANSIGADGFLARTACYYHDIGKMVNPNYFTENLASSEVDPHSSLTPEASVEMIKSHVSYGLSIARENKLPIEVQNAIVEHHGTMPIKYFYLKASKYTDGHLPYDGYTYDGPKPSSKISVILMICDACEAALRAEGDRTKAELIVDGIISERMAFEQFNQCDITMRDIDTIKSTILTTYNGIKHERVKYPNVVLKEEN